MHPVSALMFVTIGIVLVLLIGGYLAFIRKPKNRHAGDRMPERGEPGAPDVPRGVPIDPGYRARDRV
jgi:hypothetical protein